MHWPIVLQIKHFDTQVAWFKVIDFIPWTVNVIDKLKKCGVLVEGSLAIEGID